MVLTGFSPAYISDRLQARAAALQVDPQVDSSGYGVPHVELLPGPPAHPGLLLSWSSVDPYESGRGKASPDCLDAFIRLALVPDALFPDKVLRFAQKWGPLNICQHGMPCWHSPARCTSRGSVPGAERLGGPDDVGWLWEPLEPWRRYSRHLLALERLAVDLQDGYLGAPSDWADFEAGNGPSLSARQLHELYGSEWQYEHAITRPDFYTPDPDSSVDGRKWTLEKAIEVWFRYGGIKPRAIWWPDEPGIRIHIGGVGLVGALAMQIAANLSDRVYICAGCTHPFRVTEGTRRRATNKQKWCEQCGRRAQWRKYSQKRYHASKRNVL